MNDNNIYTHDDNKKFTLYYIHEHNIITIHEIHFFIHRYNIISAVILLKVVLSFH